MDTAESGWRFERGDDADNDRRSGLERRRCPDRRSGLDRRGSGACLPLSAEPRPYGFREFRERRFPQDRRLYDRDGAPLDRRVADEVSPYPDVRLTPEELAVLLGDRD